MHYHRIRINNTYKNKTFRSTKEKKLKENRLHAFFLNKSICLNNKNMFAKFEKKLQQQLFKILTLSLRNATVVEFTVHCQMPLQSKFMCV